MNEDIWHIIFKNDKENISEALCYKAPEHGAIVGLAVAYIKKSSYDNLSLRCNYYESVWKELQQEFIKLNIKYEALKETKT